MRAAKQAKDRKLYADMTSAKPISTAHGRPQVLVPFTMEYGGHLSAHTHALHLDLARKAVSAGRHRRTLRLDSKGGVGKGEGATLVSLLLADVTLQTS